MINTNKLKWHKLYAKHNTNIGYCKKNFTQFSLFMRSLGYCARGVGTPLPPSCYGSAPQQRVYAPKLGATDMIFCSKTRITGKYFTSCKPVQFQ